MKRRSFLKKGSLIAVTPMIAGIPVSAMQRSSLENFIDPEDDKILVLIQLGGGNDGLATIIPKDQQDKLAAIRDNIFIPEDKVIGLTDTVGLHPSMQGLKEVYDQGKLNILQGVGYPDQNRSHFRSSDIWHTASNSNEFLTTGWIGRYLDSKYANYPDAYPNDDYPDPFAMTIGTITSETCQGHSGNFSMAISNPDRLGELNAPPSNAEAAACYATKLDFIATAIQQTNEYGEVVKAADELGNNMSTKYVEGSSLSDKLKVVAKLISGGLKTKIYVVSQGGYDTHANQVEEGDVTVGEHAALLQELSDAICAFQDDLKLMDLEKRVVGMTYSEFGRRLRSNGSFGTDHGTAAPMMFFGECINPIIHGDNVEIDTEVDDFEGVPMQFDFRSAYGTIMMDWFGLERSTVENLLFFEFQHLPIIRNCSPTSLEHPAIDVFDLSTSPNPFENYLHINFTSKGEWLRISIFDSLGAEVKVLSDQKFSEGTHKISLAGHELSSGVYFVRIQSKTAQKTKRVVKM